MAMKDGFYDIYSKSVSTLLFLLPLWTLIWFPLLRLIRFMKNI